MKMLCIVFRSASCALHVAHACAAYHNLSSYCQKFASSNSVCVNSWHRHRRVCVAGQHVAPIVCEKKGRVAKAAALRDGQRPCDKRQVQQRMQESGDQGHIKWYLGFEEPAALLRPSLACWRQAIASCPRSMGAGNMPR